MARWEIGDDPVVIGRIQGVAVWIPDYHISGQHFVIRWEQGKRTIEDLGSRNGTWVNNKRISRQELRAGDRIQAGRTFFSFEPGLATAIQELENNSP